MEGWKSDCDCSLLLQQQWVRKSHNNFHQWQSDQLHSFTSLLALRSINSNNWKQLWNHWHKKCSRTINKKHQNILGSECYQLGRSSFDLRLPIGIDIIMGKRICETEGSVNRRMRAVQHHRGSTQDRECQHQLSKQSNANCGWELGDSQLSRSLRFCQ